MKVKIILLIFFVATCSRAFATRYYVNSSATGNGNGLSWTNAFTDLQAAFSIVVFGDEIWVAAGQYKPTSSNDRTISFVLRDGVNVYGSFAGTESSLNERNINNNPSTLNGDIGQIGEVSDNTHTIIRGNNVTTNIILDGFRIINGNSGSGFNGGAIRLTNSLNGNLLIKNCYFFSNRAVNYGGAIYLQKSKMTIEDCEFRNNQTSGGEGGAIYTLNDGAYSTLIISKTKFIGNVGRVGACLANTFDYQSLIIDRCIFTNNVSENSIVNIFYFKSAKILNSYFIGNSVNGFSSSLLYVFHTSSDNTEDFEMVNCTIAHNYNIYSNTIQTEMIDLNKPYYKVRNCIIYGNTQYNGRQMTLGHSVSNCLIENGYTGGSAIITGNPLFMSPNASANSNFDASLFTYMLSLSSPCINTGDNSFVNPLYNSDLNNQSRIQGSVVDIGCYESGVPLSVGDINVSAEEICFFDYSNNEINFKKLNILNNKLFQVYDINGRLVLNERIRSSKYKLNLRPGVYILRVVNNGFLKIVVN